ncbi:hypothetical protein G9A89_011818 [Geosiphon pyriformis]|nr:hypothetical protein G9A89_011818 [Geosiphon pyriformis]
MGALISRFQSRGDDDYEKILSELDDNIRRAEVRLAEIKIRERRAMIVWLVNSTLMYVIYVIGYLYFAWQKSGNDNWDVWALKIAPVFTVPALILIVKNFLALWYKRRESNEETQLRHLRAKQKLKVEELKKKTGYYATKTLLERFDSPKTQNQLGNPITSAQMGSFLRSGTPGEIPILRQRPVHSQSTPPLDGLNGDTSKLSKIEDYNSPGSLTTPRSYTYPPPTPDSITPLQRHWYDKLVDVIVGDEGPETKYALICENCHVHNGLVLSQEIEDIQYMCPKCNHFNPSRRSIREGNFSKNNGHSNNKLSNFKMDKSLKQTLDSVTPRRGRSTTPRSMSRESSTDQDERRDIYDDFGDDGLAVSKRLASRSTSRTRTSPSQIRVENLNTSEEVVNKPNGSESSGSSESGNDHDEVTI